MQMPPGSEQSSSSSQDAQLSISSQDALRFAWAAAQLRMGDDDTDAAVDPWDLLVGILLAHPGTSEPERTFRHFDLVAGQALPPGYPALTIAGLNRHLVSPAAVPDIPTTPQVDAILRLAASIGVPADPQHVAPLGALWAALLEDSNGPSVQIRDLLTQRGVDASLFAAETRNWAMAGIQTRPYQEVLDAFPGTPVSVVNYKADQSYTGSRLANATAVEDFVGISAEVDAFAYLLASRTIEPPLAVGLFGEWGSGKSYFLNAIRARIDQLLRSDHARRHQRDILFWKRIVQVDFNAWHYVEGDLWSSLVDHIFTQLAVSNEDDDNIVLKRQRYLLAQLKTTAEDLKNLEIKKGVIEKELGQQQQVVQTAERQRDEAMAKLDAERARRIAEAQANASRAAVLGTLGRIRLSTTPDLGVEGLTLGGAADALASARAELDRGRALLHPFLSNPRWLIALFVALAAVPAVSAIIEKASGSPTGAAFGGLAALISVAIGCVNAASQWIKGGLDEIEKAERQVTRELDEAQKGWQDAVAVAERNASAKQEQLDQVKRTETELEARLSEAERELEKKPSELLNDFLHERLDAAEYRKRLGIPAIIRRDFKNLADLISYQNAYLVAPTSAEQEALRKKAPGELLTEDDDEVINRIVLYIDDLDRCPDGKVIEVLQAVHMLLAFPLFIVVVAVDSRWLAHALQTRYPALAGPAPLDGDAARPDDYLEKIFQIPFWVQPLGDEGRSRIIRGLLRSHVRTDTAAPQAAQDGASTEIGAAGEKVLREMIEPRSAPPVPDISTLTVTEEELAFLESLAPLVGSTPRSVKRFVNVYQLIKIMRSRHDAPPESPTDEQLTAFLLAVAEGHRDFGSAFFTRVEEAAPDVTLWMLLEDGSLDEFASSLQCVKDWIQNSSPIESRPFWNGMPISRIQVLTPAVKRFLFRVNAQAGTGAVQPTLVHVIQDRWPLG